jgi:hypothetical protein
MRLRFDEPSGLFEKHSQVELRIGVLWIDRDRCLQT